MKRHYLWLAIVPVIAAGGIWAYAQEPSSTQPSRAAKVRYSQGSTPFLSPSSGQAVAQTLQGQSQPYTYGSAPVSGSNVLPTQVSGLAFPANPLPPGVPAIASFPGQPGPHNEFLELEDGKFKVVSKENPTPEDWQTDTKAKQKLSSAIQKLKSSDVEEKDLEEARSLLTNYLDAQFDHDITKREKQISNLQKQIDKLKSQLDKRKTSKEKMIEMRLTLMENETNGLGFPPAWNALPTSNGPSSFYMHTNNGPMPTFIPPQPAYANPSFPSTSSSPSPGNIFRDSNGNTSQLPSINANEKD